MAKRVAIGAKPKAQKTVTPDEWVATGGATAAEAHEQEKAETTS